MTSFDPGELHALEHLYPSPVLNWVTVADEQPQGSLSSACFSNWTTVVEGQPQGSLSHMSLMFKMMLYCFSSNSPAALSSMVIAPWGHSPRQAPRPSQYLSLIVSPCRQQSARLFSTSNHTQTTPIAFFLVYLDNLSFYLVYRHLSALFSFFACSCSS